MVRAQNFLLHILNAASVVAKFSQRCGGSLQSLIVYFKKNIWEFYML